MGDIVLNVVRVNAPQFARAILNWFLVKRYFVLSFKGAWFFVMVKKP
jgi:hypothetical protein